MRERNDFVREEQRIREREREKRRKR